MIVFELTMPNVNSWNGRWTGETKRYIRTLDERKLKKEYWNKDFYYNFGDGWCACVSAKRMNTREARKLEKLSSGFCGYDWMIRSIVECGHILTESKRTQKNEKEVK